MNPLQISQGQAVVLCELEGKPSSSNEQWILVLPSGMLPVRDGRGPWFVSDVGAVIANTKRLFIQNLMVVDYEHQSVKAPENGKPAPAAGWVHEIVERGSGVWALVKWNEEAASLIKSKQYKYISPVITVHPKTGEVKAIHSIALTNTPAIAGLPELARKEINQMDEIAKIIEALGLKEGTDIEDVLAEITRLQKAQDAEVDPSKYVPREVFERVVSEVNKVSDSLTKNEANTYVEASIKQGALPPYLKDWAVQLCTINKGEFDAFLQNTSKPLKAFFSSQIPDNRKGGTLAGSTLDELEIAVCAQLGVKHETFAELRMKETGE
ncbi:MAG: phage protease [Pseudomonadota bacterium]